MMHRSHADKVRDALSTLTGPEQAKSAVLRLIKEWENDYDAAVMTEEEGSEVYAEQTAAMAVLFGEALKPCSAPCPGHLGEKAMAAHTAATHAWASLQELVVGQAQRIHELEAIVIELPMTTFDAKTGN